MERLPERLTVRLPEHVMADLSAYAVACGVDDATAARLLIRRGLAAEGRVLTEPRVATVLGSVARAHEGAEP